MIYYRFSQAHFAKFFPHISCYYFVPHFPFRRHGPIHSSRKIPHFHPTKKIIQQLLSTEILETTPYNTFQKLILAHYPELKTLFQILQNHGYHPCVTGSGSGCFIIHRAKNFLERAEHIIAEYWQTPSLVIITTFKT